MQRSARHLDTGSRKGRVPEDEKAVTVGDVRKDLLFGMVHAITRRRPDSTAGRSPRAHAF
jgi:hypothetical protein